MSEFQENATKYMAVLQVQGKRLHWEHYLQPVQWHPAAVLHHQSHYSFVRFLYKVPLFWILKRVPGSA
ncbi:hypothetical protein GN956_G11777 [Arapaima gigas]